MVNDNGKVHKSHKKASGGRGSIIESLSAYEQYIEKLRRERTRKGNDPLGADTERVLAELDHLYDEHVNSSSSPAPIIADTDRKAFKDTVNIVNNRMRLTINGGDGTLTANSFAQRVKKAWTDNPTRTDLQTRRYIGRLLFQTGRFVRGISTLRDAVAIKRTHHSGPRQRTVREDGVADTANTLTEADLGTDQNILQTYGLIKRLIEADYRANGEPLSLYLLVLNPSSYAQTVENLFHVSLLVNDGALATIQSANGLPLILPATKLGDQPGTGENSQETGPRNQFVAHMNYDIFDKLCKVLTSELTDEDGKIVPYITPRRETDSFDRRANPIA